VGGLNDAVKLAKSLLAVSQPESIRPCKASAIHRAAKDFDTRAV
jgi:hypothetical protein